jgi:excisionase family DNA binding protein
VDNGLRVYHNRSKAMTEFLDGWITTTEAQALTSYSRAYLRWLANQGRVEARKAGRDWLIHRESLLEYKRQMDALGLEKHNPWRDDLAGKGLGRKRAMLLE